AGNRLQSPTADFERAIQLDSDLLVRTRDLPWIRVTQPVVRPLLLPAVVDRLPEHAVFVAQSVAHGGAVQRRHRVEKARCQAPEPAIAQARVGFPLEQLEPIEV